MHGALRRHLPAFVRSRTKVRSLAHLVGSLNHLCLVGMRLQIHVALLRMVPCLLTDGFVRLASLQVVRCLCYSPCYVFGCQGSVNDRYTLSSAAILQN